MGRDRLINHRSRPDAVVSQCRNRPGGAGMQHRTIAMLVGLGGSTLAAPGAGAEPLGVGDPAPPVPAGVEWLQGEPVERLDDGRVYAIDFWSTWCGPCIASIPEIQRMHEDLREQGVVVIGAHIWASPDAPDPADFLDAQGEAMTYSVTVDENDTMAAAFMEAAGRNSIPTMMIIGRDGRIAWIGHPMDGARDIVERVAAGTFDLEAAEAAQANREVAAACAATANQHAMEGDWDGAFAKIDEAIALDPDGQRHLAVVKVQRLALTLDREEEAYAWGREIVAGVIKDDAALLTNLGRFLVEAPRLEPRDYDLARAAVHRALELTGDQHADALATLASIEFADGRLEQAVEMQRRALALAEAQESNLVREFRRLLEEYEAAWNEAKPPPF